MPRPETSHRLQKAVLWDRPDTGNPSDYDDYGEPKASTREEINVRVVEGKREAIDTQGNPIDVDLTLHVGQDIPVSSTVWIGELDDLPSSPTDLYRVVSYNETPDVKGRYLRREIGLKRLSDSLPVST